MGRGLGTTPPREPGSRSLPHTEQSPRPPRPIDGLRDQPFAGQLSRVLIPRQSWAHGFGAPGRPRGSNAGLALMPWEGPSGYRGAGLAEHRRCKAGVKWAGPQ